MVLHITRACREIAGRTCRSVTSKHCGDLFGNDSIYQHSSRQYPAYQQADGGAVSTGGFSPRRLARVRDILDRQVEAGYIPGAVAVVARHGEVHIEAAGNLAFAGAGSSTPMAADTICRMASMTKPVVAACAMTLVEDCTLRLDDPVDEFLPELADMTVLADRDGPLDDTVPAKRPITLRDLLTFTLGTGMVVAEPGAIPIADALNALQ